MSHGPLIGPPAIVSTTFPVLSRTSKQPACAVWDMPSLVGRLPTTTNPLRSAPSAVVRPTPPGQGPGNVAGLIEAKSFTVPPGVISSIVVPVPCRFAELLKLLIRRSPRVRFPTDRGTTTIPYGFTSPFAGTVEARLVTVWNRSRNGPRLRADAIPPLAAHEATAIPATTPFLSHHLTIALRRLE